MMPRTRILYATNKRTFLDISRLPERALALINFVAATKTEELITSFSMHSRESFSLAFLELAPYISSRLSSYIEIRERVSPHIHAHTHTSLHGYHIVGAWVCRTWGVSRWKANEVQSFPRRLSAFARSLRYVLVN